MGLIDIPLLSFSFLDDSSLSFAGSFTSHFLAINIPQISPHTLQKWCYLLSSIITSIKWYHLYLQPRPHCFSLITLLHPLVFYLYSYNFLRSDKFISSMEFFYCMYTSWYIFKFYFYKLRIWTFLLISLIIPSYRITFWKILRPRLILTWDTHSKIT